MLNSRMVDEIMDKIKEANANIDIDIDIEDLSCLKDLINDDSVEFNSVDECIKYLSAFKIGLDVQHGRIKKSEVKKKLFEFIKKITDMTTNNKDYPMITQGTSLNKLAKVNSKKNISTDTKYIDEINCYGSVTKVDQNFSLYISLESKYAVDRGFTDSAAKLLDMFILGLTKKDLSSDTVTINLNEYMEYRGLKDRKEAKLQLKKDYDILRYMTFSSTETIKENKRKIVKSFTTINLAYQGCITTAGQVTISFSPRFMQMMKNYYSVMPYPTDLLKISGKNNPYGYALGRKIIEHKNMNYNKKNADIISVSSLIEMMIVLGLPSKEVVETSKTYARHFSRYIIAPFIRDMNALNNIFDWEFVLNNNIIEKDNKMPYDTFIKLNVHILWKNYPTRKLDRRSK